jgi:hypothetical protein
MTSLPIRLTPDCYCKNMDYLTTYWDTCCNYEGGYAEKQYNYMPSLICKNILTKNCSILMNLLHIIVHCVHQKYSHYPWYFGIWDLGRNGKITLKWAPKKYGAKAWTELIWPNRVQMGASVHTIMSVRFLTATGHYLKKTNVHNTHLQISIQYHDLLSGDEQVNFCAGLRLPFWCLNWQNNHLSAHIQQW